MRDPELVARAQRAAARLESAWERWRALQGLGETPAQPVIGYVGYALKEPWGQPRAVIGFSADEAERLADFLERGNADHHAVELAQRHIPDQPSAAQPLAAATAAKTDVLVATSQLAGLQPHHSFLTGSGARLLTTAAELRSPCRMSGLGTARPRPESRHFLLLPVCLLLVFLVDFRLHLPAGTWLTRRSCACRCSRGRPGAEARPCSTCTGWRRSGSCSGTPGSPWWLRPSSSPAGS